MIRITTAAALAIMLSAAVLGAEGLQTAAKPPAAASAPVNLNTATVPQLETLPGVGRSTAERIVEYRQKNGDFKKIEELMNVRGIGEKSFLKLKPMITVAARGEQNAKNQ